MNGPPRTKTRIEMLSINGTTSFVVYMSRVDVSNLHHSSKSQKSSPSLDDLNLKPFVCIFGQDHA